MKKKAKQRRVSQASVNGMFEDRLDNQSERIRELERNIESLHVRMQETTRDLNTTAAIATKLMDQLPKPGWMESMQSRMVELDNRMADRLAYINDLFKTDNERLESLESQARKLFAKMDCRDEKARDFRHEFTELMLRVGILEERMLHAEPKPCACHDSHMLVHELADALRSIMGIVPIMEVAMNSPKWKHAHDLLAKVDRVRS